MKPTNRLNNVHPGEVLREEFVEPLGITPYRLAKAIGVQQTRLSEILKGKRSITTDTAIRLGRFFRVTPQFWLNLQQMYDLEEEQSNPKHKAAYEKIHAYEPMLAGSVAPPK
jgi:addiction module HigA family antidote